MDAAGPNTLGGTLFKEGTGYAPLPTSNIEYTMFRKQSGGTPQDTNNNAADFIFGDTAATPTTAGQLLAAPGPENLSSPVQRNATIPSALLDATLGATSSPNRVRDPTPDAPNNSSFGTMSIRRRFVNNTGQPVTKLRFRIINVTTSPAPANVADLRARSSSDTTAGSSDSATCAAASLSTPCTVTVRGTTLEEPPTQSTVMGGGWNSTFSVGAITLNAPLANGASVDVQFLVGVQQPGAFRIFVNVEAVP
jgi:hypothetical protein